MTVCALDKYILTGKDEAEVSKVAKGDEHTYVQKIGNIKSITDFKTIFQTFSDGWIFRGQRDARWALDPPIQRYMRYANWDSYEEPLVDILVSHNSVSKRWPQIQALSYLEKLAYIQHYGGMTRFLDFSCDWHVACFFALSLDSGWSFRNIISRINGSSEFCVVWALNLKEIKNKALQLMSAEWPLVPNSEEKILDEVIKTDKTMSFVYPFDLGSSKSCRMKRQQGLLLAQCDPSISFGNNLFNVSENRELSRDDYQQFAVMGKKIYIPLVLKKEIEKHFNQSGFSKNQLLPDSEAFSEMTKLIHKVESKAKKRLNAIKKMNHVR